MKTTIPVALLVGCLGFAAPGEAAERVDAALRHPALNRITSLDASAGPAVVLVAEGQAQAAIFADAASLEAAGKTRQAAALRMAADELQAYIEQATGAKLPIVAEMPATGAVILLGGSPEAIKLGVDADALAEDAFVVRTFPDRVVIAGRYTDTLDSLVHSCGTYWGVCDFLERFLGIRWYYPGTLGTIVPKTRNLAIAPVAYSDAPVFRKREIYRFRGIPFPGTRPARHADTHTYAHFRLGNSSRVPTPCHTPIGWAEVYGKTNPDYFQMGADGVRRPPMWCYSNPGVLKQFVADLDRFYASGMQWDDPWTKPRSWQKPTETVIPISPLDAPVECYCPDCLKHVRRDAPLGYSSQILGQFVYNLSIEAGKRWPDKRVAFLPYSNYTEPPKDIVYPDNFIAVLCWMRSLANLKEPEILRREFETYAGWKKIVRQPVGHWIYTCWPADCTTAPFQYPHVMKDYFTRLKGDLGFFCDAGVDWARKHLTHYLMARLMWNPDFDVDAALGEYYGLMYGAASAPMSRLYGLLIDRWESSRWASPPLQGHRISVAHVHNETYPAPVVGEMKQLMEQALAAAATGSIEHERIAYVKTAMDPFFDESDRFHSGGGRKELQVLRVGARPKVDGLFDEAFWSLAPEGTFATLDRDASEPRFATRVKAVWIPGEGVAFGFTLAEPDPGGIKANAIQHDEMVYADDCIEMFLDPWAKFDRFFQIVFNTKGTLFDALYFNEGKGWNSDNIERRAHIGKDAWTLEIFIPFATLQIGKAATGDQWYGNFTRSRWRGEDKGGNELSRFSTDYTAKGDLSLRANLNTAHFCILKFIE